jgi:hypothetical protein
MRGRGPGHWLSVAAIAAGVVIIYEKFGKGKIHL